MIDQIYLNDAGHATPLVDDKIIASDRGVHSTGQYLWQEYASGLVMMVQHVNDNGPNTTLKLVRPIDVFWARESYRNSASSPPGFVWTQWSQAANAEFHDRIFISRTAANSASKTLLMFGTAVHNYTPPPEPVVIKAPLGISDLGGYLSGDYSSQVRFYVMNLNLADNVWNMSIQDSLNGDASYGNPTQVTTTAKFTLRNNKPVDFSRVPRLKISARTGENEWRTRILTATDTKGSYAATGAVRIEPFTTSLGQTKNRVIGDDLFGYWLQTDMPRSTKVRVNLEFLSS